MEIQFSKYQGTGNDFVIIDNRDGSIALSNAQIAFLCDRRFGVGSDGLIMLGTATGYDFSISFFLLRFYFLCFFFLGQSDLFHNYIK